MTKVFEQGELRKLNRMCDEDFAKAHGLPNVVEVPPVVCPFCAAVYPNPHVKDCEVALRGKRRMPRQKPGLSKQDYATPPDLIAAIKKRFGVKEFAYDLAASIENTKARYFFCEEEDSLKQHWTRLRGDLWLNPPFARIAPWAAKCCVTATNVRRIFFLVPAAVGSNWWRDYVHEKSRVVFLNGRPSFDGVAGFPKDIALCVYGAKYGYECWRWK